MNTATATRPVGIQARVAIVTCSCGFYPLDKAMHLTSAAAWRAAADHVSLNPSLCRPQMFWDHVPAGLVARRA